VIFVIGGFSGRSTVFTQRHQRLPFALFAARGSFDTLILYIRIRRP
jgi:hypothetical protein